MRVKKFSPIIKEIIRVKMQYPFKLYKKLEDGSFLLLYDIDEIIPKGDDLRSIDEFYIKSEDRINYQEYLEANIDKIIDNETINIEAKAEFLIDLISSTMSSLYNEKTSIRNIKKTLSVAENLVDLLLEEDAMNEMLKANEEDNNIHTHCINVALYSISFGIYLGLNKEDLYSLGKASFLQNLGTKDIDRTIIYKRGKLTENEFKKMKMHPQLGVKTLRLMGITNKTLLTIIEQHHEKCDGKGYPKALKEGEIFYLTKIMTLCDIFVAMSSKRSFRDEMSTFKTLNTMVIEMKGQLSQKYLREFVNFMKGELG